MSGLPEWWPPAAGAVLEDADHGRGIVCEDAVVQWSDGHRDLDVFDLREDVEEGRVILLMA
jgi:hypothetical protein